jgi:hypothetical protein
MEEQRRSIMEPWRVADEEGKVPPIWQQWIKVFEPKGRISQSARQLPRRRSEGLDLETLVGAA